MVSFEDIVNPAGVAQPACTLCGDCCSGCNVGAKNTVAMTYLPDAKAHGAEIFTELGVTHIAKGEGGWRVHFVPSSDRDAGPAFVDASTVVLAAGTLGSTEILLRSRERGLGLSDRLGERFSANGDIIAFALGGSERVNAVGVGHPPKFVGDAIGACVAGQIELADGETLDHSMIVQEGVLPSALAPLLPVFFIAGGRLLGAAQSLIKGVYPVLCRIFIPSSSSPMTMPRAASRSTNGSAQVRWPGVGGPAGLCPCRCRADQGRGGGRRALHQEPACRDQRGNEARDRSSAWRLRHGRGCGERRGEPQMPGFRRGGQATASMPDSMSATAR